MYTKRTRRWAWIGLALCGALCQGTSCVSFDLMRQVFADQIALTAATLTRGVVSAFFGTVTP